MTAKVERLVNLAVALLETRRPLTLAEIRRTVAGYAQDDPETARRMFERDKDDLRRLGVPVETVPVDASQSEWGYRIDRREYALPPVDLTAEEVAALAVALEVTGEDAARLGLAKLVARAPDPDPSPAPPASTRVGIDPGPLDDVAAALVERRSLRFAYRSASGTESTRTVDPYGVVQRRGSWYLVGRDHAREAIRVFRLDRVTTAPAAVGDPGAYEVPDGIDVVALAAGPAGEGVDVDADVAAHVVWEATRRGGRVVGDSDGGAVRVRFDAADPGRLLPWLLGLGADAVVVAPSAVREEAAARLRGLAGGPA